MRDQPSRSSQLMKFMNNKLFIIMSSDTSRTKAQLARLRHGLGKKPGDDPELWAALFEDLPEELESRGDAPSAVEIAVYAALTLYAVHQQGKDPITEPMHEEGCRIGNAIAKLAVKEHDENAFEATRKRFNKVATSLDITELVWHLRGIVQLLRRESIPMDYAELTSDLYRYQNPAYVSSVRLRWGRDFYREYNKAMRKTVSDNNERKDDNNEE